MVNGSFLQKRIKQIRDCWTLSIQLKIPEISVRNQMERIISVRSDRDIWEHLWRWSNLIGPTEFLSICQIVVPNTGLLYPAYKYDNQTLGTLIRS